MAPMKVFGSAPFTNVARVLVCLEEIGAEYDLVDIDFHVKQHKAPEQLARNVRQYKETHIGSRDHSSLVLRVDLEISSRKRNKIRK